MENLPAQPRANSNLIWGEGGGALLLSSKISSLCKIFLETVSHNPLSVLKDNSDFKTVELLFDLYCALHYLFLMIWNYNSEKNEFRTAVG